MANDGVTPEVLLANVATMHLDEFDLLGAPPAYVCDELVPVLAKSLAPLLAAAREEGRREGFEKARDTIAAEYDARVSVLRRDAERASGQDARADLGDAARLWKGEADRIRAMRDGAEGQERRAAGTGAIQAEDPPGRSVEHVRTVLLRALAERPGHPVRRAVESIAGDLGVSLEVP